MTGLRTLCWGFVLAFSFSPAVLADTFTDDFNRADGPAGGWTVAYGNWQIASGALDSGVTSTAESWIWAGAPPISCRGDIEVRAKVAFSGTPADAVGRHGGFMFYAGVATQRWEATTHGYTLDWFDSNGWQNFRLLRVDPGVTASVHTPLWTGATPIADVPLNWVIQVEGDLIRFTADDQIIFEVVDATYREGYLGVWAYSNGNDLIMDDLEYTYQPIVLDACFTASTTTGTASLEVDFDATCTTSVHGVASYEWDFGDGDIAAGATASHTYIFGGSYMVTLTVYDAVLNTDTATVTITVLESTGSFSDNFDRDDGPVDGWTVFRGTWNIQGQRLTTTTAGAENWAWAGDPAFSFPANFTMTYTYEFIAKPTDVVGRHGGVMFCATKPTWRYDTTISGYTIDWIDRVDDHGIRLIRVDKGAQIVLDIGGAALLDPPINWQIVVEGEAIRVYGDGEQLLEATDSTYRRGVFGVWAWVNSQTIAIDDVDVTSPTVSACFTATPKDIVEVGTEVTFDASCSSATGTPIVAYDWDFGDGATGQGSLVTHAYSTAGLKTVTLTARTEGGLTGTTDRPMEAFVTLDSFEDDFAREDGTPSGWTVRTADWSLRGGVLHVETPTVPESWIWAGDPPVRFKGITSIEFRLDFLNDAPADPAAVGRHAGAFFFAQNTNPRGGNSGYAVDWIDRAGDHGYRLGVFNAGVERGLAVGTADVAPGALWRIEIEGETIRLLVDGALKLEAVDNTYRTGFFGFWAYPGDPAATPPFVQLADFDDVKIGTGGPQLPQFHRGDADQNDALELTDAIQILGYLFLGTATRVPECQDAADADDNGTIELTDAIRILGYLFLGTGEVPPPGPPEEPCGPDPGEVHLGCEGYEGC